jgi:hypothetical protein
MIGERTVMKLELDGDIVDVVKNLRHTSREYTVITTFEVTA